MQRNGMKEREWKKREIRKWIEKSLYIFVIKKEKRIEDFYLISWKKENRTNEWKNKGEKEKGLVRKKFRFVEWNGRKKTKEKGNKKVDLKGKKCFIESIFVFAIKKKKRIRYFYLISWKRKWMKEENGSEYEKRKRKWIKKENGSEQKKKAEVNERRKRKWIKKQNGSEWKKKAEVNMKE